MAFFSAIEKIQGITSGELTVRERVRLANNPLGLRYPTFFPVRPVRSTKLTEVYRTDHRPVADRRVPNAPGRLITKIDPKIREMKIRPVEAYMVFGEEELEELLGQTQGNQATMKELMGYNVSDSSQEIADAVERRIEVDAYQAWLNGTVTVKNPQTGGTEVHSLGFAASRYVADDWSGVNDAWLGFVAFLESAQNILGSLAGVGMRQATWNKIRADAPNPFNTSTQVTNAQLRAMIDDEMPGVRVAIDERTVDIYDDGGTALTSTNIWPTGKVAAIPQGGMIGETLDAPVARAFEVQGNAPEIAGARSGVAMFNEALNTGKELMIQGQRNALAVPVETKVLVYSVSV